MVIGARGRCPVPLAIQTGDKGRPRPIKTTRCAEGAHAENTLTTRPNGAPVGCSTCVIHPMAVVPKISQLAAKAGDPLSLASERAQRINDLGHPVDIVTQTMPPCLTPRRPRRRVVSKGRIGR